MKRIPWDDIAAFGCMVIFVAFVAAILFVVAPDVAALKEVGR